MMVHNWLYRLHDLENKENFVYTKYIRYQDLQIKEKTVDEKIVYIPWSRKGDAVNYILEDFLLYELGTKVVAELALCARRG